MLRKGGDELGSAGFSQRGTQSNTLGGLCEVSFVTRKLVGMRGDERTPLMLSVKHAEGSTQRGYST